MLRAEREDMGGRRDMLVEVLGEVGGGRKGPRRIGIRELDEGGWTCLLDLRQSTHLLRSCVDAVLNLSV